MTITELNYRIMLDILETLRPRFKQEPILNNKWCALCKVTDEFIKKWDAVIASARDYLPTGEH